MTGEIATVAEIMTRASVTDSESDPLTTAAERMWRQQTGSLLVMDGDRLVGIVTERDVMKAVARGMDLAATPVSAVMTTNLLTVTTSTPVAEAARHMSERWIRHLPVVEEERVVGMVSQRDLCGLLAKAEPGQLPAAGDAADLVRDRRLSRVDPEPPVLPSTTADERALGWGDPPADHPTDSNDSRLLSDRPPHWDGG